MKALAGVRVLDLSRVLAGPWSSQLLADLGAEVIKVEHPHGGDETRGWGPPWLGGENGEDGPSAYFLASNRGKRSVGIDFSHPRGQELLRQLAADSDILLENFRPGRLARYGLDYTSLSSLNPGLIYCSISGFGQTGPYRERAGYDLLLQAMGGLMSITGPRDDEGGEPVKVGVALTDILTGLYATIGCLAALREREATGQGQHIDLALMDVQVATLANQAMNYLVGGQIPGRMGSAHPNIVPYQAFRAADDWLVLAVGNDGQFQRLCQVLDQADLADDPRFRRNADRVANREQLLPLIEQVLAKQPRRHWLDLLEAAEVPAGPVNDMAAVFDDPQVRHRGLARTLWHERLGGVPSVANPLLSGTNWADSSKPPPLPGEDTETTLKDRLGLDSASIGALRREGIIR
ncbi:CoA transferase [Gammaproteobacteria bacterium AB-CW1]|uniref:CoA transferase n=1 Tax=Natronospira elongata TaxID=3110268 RepID=A0AAP6MMZ2_9GAMM|nr:CoA transferase [Gammaproteobacteria bacterium AB-CW1]